MDGVVIKKCTEEVYGLEFTNTLGGNTGNIHSYIEDMKAVYYREDVREVI